MKKTLWLALILLLVCVFSFSACDTGDTPPANNENNQQTSDNQNTEEVEGGKIDSENTSESEDATKVPPTECQHSFDNWNTVKQATCKEEGKLVRTCSKCSATEESTVSKTNIHTEIVDAAIPATCTADGKTEGKHCSVCDEIIIAQTTIGKLDHVEVIDAAVAATCTIDGKAEGKHCSRCNATLVAQTTIGKLGHIEVIDTAVAATCTTDGKTEGKHCSRCNTTLIAQTVVGKLGHVEVIDAAVAATCTTDGKTEGKHCSRCNEILKAQNVIEKGHTYNADVTNPTRTESGYTTYTCNGCGFSYVGSYVLPTLGLEYRVNDDGITCTITNATHCTESDLVIPSIYDGYRITAINEFAFSGCTSLKSIVIPDFITQIGNGAFKGCSSLEKITLPFIGESKDATGYKSMFGFIFGYTNGYGANKITNATYQCVEGDYWYHYYIPKSLTSIILSDAITSIGEGVFYNCKNIVDIKLGSDVTEIGECAFEYCSNLKTITIPAGVKVISMQSFANCGLETVIFAEGSVCESIDWNGFRACKKLTTIALPTTVTNIGQYAFYECTSLIDFIIPENVTNIGSNAFALSGIKTIHIPKSVKYIGYQAFANLTSYSMDITTGWKRGGEYVGAMTLTLLKRGDLTHS